MHHIVLQSAEGEKHDFLVNPFAQAPRRHARASRPGCIQRALEMHLEEVAKQETPGPSGLYEGLMKFAGAGAKLHGGLSKEEIDADIRWSRGDD